MTKYPQQEFPISIGARIAIVVIVLIFCFSIREASIQHEEEQALIGKVEYTRGVNKALNTFALYNLECQMYERSENLEQQFRVVRERLRVKKSD